MKVNTIMQGLVAASISALAMSMAQAADKPAGTQGMDAQRKHAEMMAKGANHQTAQAAEDKDKEPDPKAKVQKKKHDDALKAGVTHTEAQHAGH